MLQVVAAIGRVVPELSLGARLWRYTLLGALSIVFEEANPIYGGIAIRHGRLGAAGVVTAVAVGTWIPSLLLYLLGRWQIDWVRRRWPDRQQPLDAALAIVRHNPWLASLSIRFAYGLRLPVPIACGAARVPFPLYLTASGISCWGWSILFTYLGFAMGRAALAVLRFTRRWDVRLGVVALFLLALLYVLSRRRRIAERTARVLTGEEISLAPEEHEPTGAPEPPTS